MTAINQTPCLTVTCLLFAKEVLTGCAGIFAASSLVFPCLDGASYRDKTSEDQSAAVLPTFLQDLNPLTPTQNGSCVSTLGPFHTYHHTSSSKLCPKQGQAGNPQTMPRTPVTLILLLTIAPRLNPASSRSSHPNRPHSHLHSSHS